MLTHTNIEQVNVETSKCGENLKPKRKVKAVSNYRINLGYTEDNEPGYYWSEYITRDYLPEVTEDLFTHMIQSVITNRGQRRKGGHTPYITRL